MPFSFPKPGRRTNEDVFFDYYPRLLDWATQITHRDREEAEDLVHDLYFRVARISRPIDEIESPDSYLFRIIRNLYHARLRRAGRDSINDLSIVDYDSIEQGLAAVDRRQLLCVRANLREVCRYACQRKGTARSASVLILRFFLGYYASEVMKILQAPRYSVDRSLQVARREARMFLERPGTLRFIAKAARPEPLFSGDESSQRLFAELKEAIFSTAEGECFAPAALEQRYSSTSRTSPFTALELAHLVSCKTCLDRVNTILQLPLLAERSPESGLDRDHTPGPGGAGDSGTPTTLKPGRKGPLFKKLERRAREHYEHRPESLQVVVDGEVRSSQRVTAEKNELYLKLDRREELSFVEVISEQGFCMAYLPVEAPGSSKELVQTEEVLLSDDRCLVLNVSFASDVPIIRVLYHDPVMAGGVTSIGGEDASDWAIEAERISNEGLPPIVFRPERWIRRWRGELSAWLQRHFLRNRNSLLASAALLTLGALVCFWPWHKPVTPLMSESAFLQRAEAADQAAVSSIEPEVISQKVRIRTASLMIERTIHRDTSGRRKPKKQPLDQKTAALRAKLAGAGVKWDEPLSAATYQDWREHSHVTADTVRKTGDNLLTLTTTVADADVTEESLTIRATDFHPVARTISFRDTGNVEIAELDYSVMPWRAADPEWFEPEARAAISDAPTLHAVLHLPHVLSDLELDEAELAARTTLNQLHADTGEQISLTRTNAGIEIKGVVATNARKQELMSHLMLIPNVHSTILSVEEIGSRLPSRASSGDEQAIQVYSVDAQPSPLEKYLRAKNLPVDQLASISLNLLDSGVRISLAEAHLADLQSHFNGANQLPPDRQAQLQTLTHNYVQSILSAVDANSKILASLGLNPGGQTDATFTSDNSGTAIDDQIRQYQQLCQDLISNGATESRSAPQIAEEVLRMGQRIRAHFAAISATAPEAHN